ncbi:MAG: hypothetical protein ACRDGM_16910 [bacterium]
MGSSCRQNTHAFHQANDVYHNGDPEAMAKAEGVVQAHIAAQPALMAVMPAERQAAHASH